MQEIQEYLQGTPASYSIKDGKIVRWESEKPQPTEEQLAELRQKIETRTIEKNKLPSLEERVEELERAMVTLQPNNNEIKKTINQVEKVKKL